MTRPDAAPMQKLFKTLMLTLLTAATGSLSAAPVGYSINSDSGSDDSDGLYLIDLDTGATIKRIGTVKTVSADRRIDVEGLAFAPNGTLYGVDDESMKLFGINHLTNALVDPANDHAIKGLTKGRYDFGLTFACDGSLYLTSVSQQSLYQVDPASGTTFPIGPPGMLGVNISAIAAHGNPTMLYGLGNGTAGDNAASTPYLYSIDILTNDPTCIIVGGGTSANHYLAYSGK